VIDGGNGDDIEIQSLTEGSRGAATDVVTSASTADADWVTDHVRIDGGVTVIEVDGAEHELAATDMSQLVADANAEVAAEETAPPTTEATTPPTEATTETATWTPPATTEPPAG
jgi:hypothetical protein